MTLITFTTPTTTGLNNTHDHDYYHCHEHSYSCPRNDERRECNRHIWEVFFTFIFISCLLLAGRPLGSVLSKDIGKGLSCSRRRICLWGDDEGHKKRRHAKAQNALNENTHCLDVHPHSHRV